MNRISRLRPLSRLALVLAAAGLAVLADVLLRAAPGSPPGRSAPEPQAQALFALTLPDADGREQALAQWRGKILVVNFWATWCVPCLTEMPDLERLQAQFGTQRLAVVALGVEDPGPVHKFRQRTGLHLPLLAGGFDALGIARDLGDMQGVLPYTVVFSPEGRILYTHSGALEPGPLRERIADFLKGVPAA